MVLLRSLAVLLTATALHALCLELEAMQERARRAEVPADTTSILTAALAYEAAFGLSPQTCGDREAAEAAQQSGAGGLLSGCQIGIEWRPTSRGVYWLEVEDGALTAYGLDRRGVLFAAAR